MTEQQLREVRALLKTALEILASVSGDGGESCTPLPVTPDVPAPAKGPQSIDAQLAGQGFCPNCGGTGEDYNWFVGEPTKCSKCDGSGMVEDPASRSDS